MSKKQWWHDCEAFLPWKLCPTRPDPTQVLHFYLEKRGIASEQHLAYLMDLLDLQKSMVYNLLHGEGFDTISRCRLLVQALKIPPPLLGIDAKFYPIQEHPFWWKAYSFSFNADVQGYPVVSEVVAYLRQQRTQVDEEGKVKKWSQQDLGDATGLRKEAAYRMEHAQNPQVLESMSRRAIVASALGMFAGDRESIIFRLFGLDPQAYDVPLPASERVPVISLFTKHLTEETLQVYHQEQAACFAEYDTGHAQNTIIKALEAIQQCQMLFSLALTTAQRIDVLALQSRYHQLLLLMASEQQERDLIVFHADEAIRLAEYATTLPEPGDTAKQQTCHELLATALYRTALAYDGLGQYDVAHDYIDRALHELPTVQSRPLKTEILLAAALISAHRVKNAIDQQLVLSYIDQAMDTIPVNQSSLQSEAPDDNFTRCGKGLVYLRKAMALNAPQMKGATEETVAELLKDAQWLTPAELVRRHTLIEVFQALTHFAEGEYQEAIEVALNALEKSRQVQSRLNRSQVEGLYRQLLNTSFSGKPRLAYLGVNLRFWNHGMG